LESCNSCDHQALEEHRQSRLASGKPTIEKTDARDNQPDNETTEDKICVVVFKADILGVDIDFLRIASIRMARVELWGSE
jgi:hypothetical protein